MYPSRFRLITICPPHPQGQFCERHDVATSITHHKESERITSKANSPARPNRHNGISNKKWLEPNFVCAFFFILHSTVHLFRQCDPVRSFAHCRGLNQVHFAKAPLLHNWHGAQALTTETRWPEHKLANSPAPSLAASSSTLRAGSAGEEHKRETHTHR